MIKKSLFCKGLSVSYGHKIIFENIDLNLDYGIYSLIGPNGTGKSTLLRSLCGAKNLDSGDVWINGKSLVSLPKEAKKHLSYVPDEAIVYPFMTGKNLLDFCAWTKKTNIDLNVLEMIEKFDLKSHLTTRFDVMSLGTRKKILICAALVGAPKVIFMDEPTNGLDATSLKHLAQLLKGLSRSTVVLMSTHDYDFLNEVETISIIMKEISQSHNFYCKSAI